MSNSALLKLMAQTRIEDLRADAARAGRRLDAGVPSPRGGVGARSPHGGGSVRSPRGGEPADVAITIRPALPDDAGALTRLAGLDSARVPSGEVLIAETKGQVRAALSLRDGAAIADPFHQTAAMVQLLRARAVQLCGEPPRRGLSRLATARLFGRWRWRASLSRST